VKHRTAQFGQRRVIFHVRGVGAAELEPSEHTARIAGAKSGPRRANERLQDVIADAANAFDLIVIDDGLSSTESVLLASPRSLDTVVMVVESGNTRRDELQEGLDALRQSRSKLAGAVLAA